MIKTIAAIIISLSVAGCSGAPSPAVQTAQSTAQASIKLLNDAWIAAAQVCLYNVVDSHKCGPILHQAYEYIQVAARASDAWVAQSQGEISCAVGSASAAVYQAFTIIGVQIPQLVADALQAAQALSGFTSGACVADAGAE